MQSKLEMTARYAGKQWLQECGGESEGPSWALELTEPVAFPILVHVFGSVHLCGAARQKRAPNLCKPCLRPPSPAPPAACPSHMPPGA